MFLLIATYVCILQYIVLKSWKELQRTSYCKTLHEDITQEQYAFPKTALQLSNKLLEWLLKPHYHSFPVELEPTSEIASTVFSYYKMI